MAGRGHLDQHQQELRAARALRKTLTTEVLEGFSTADDINLRKLFMESPIFSQVRISKSSTGRPYLEKGRSAERAACSAPVACRLSS